MAGSPPPKRVILDNDKAVEVVELLKQIEAAAKQARKLVQGK